jgi:hypothetical protein
VAATHQDVRGLPVTQEQLEQAATIKNWSLSQSELVATLRGQLHTGGAYTLEQLIHDVENLTPRLLDLAAQRQRA